MKGNFRLALLGLLFALAMTACGKKEDAAAIGTEVRTLEGMSLSMAMPVCAVIKKDEADQAFVQPDGPECKALPPTGIQVRFAKQDFETKEEYQKYATGSGGEIVAETAEPAGFTIEYKKPMTGVRGWILVRPVGGIELACRGEALNDVQFLVIKKACDSLAPAR